MDHLPDIAKFLGGIGTVLWPLLGFVAILKLWPVVESILLTAKSRKFTIKVAGQELSMEQASQQSHSLIEDLETKIIELSRRVEANNASTQDVKPDTPSLAIYQFAEGDLALQKSRIALADNISQVIDSGLNEFSLSQIQQFIIAQHNTSWSFEISASNVSDHLEEAEALYNYLTKKLIDAPPNKHSGEVASALGIMKHNMLGRIPGLPKKAER